MSIQTQVTCPNCNEEINVNQILYQKLEKDVQNKFKIQVEAHRTKYKDAVNLLKEKEKQVTEQNESFNGRLASTLTEKLKIEKEQLSISIKSKVEEEQKDRILLMEKELNEKSIQVMELNRSKAEVSRLKREKDELYDKVNLEAQNNLNTQLEIERKRIYKLAQNKNELKLKEKEVQLIDLHKKLEEARRQAEQGSQQTQGEIQELAIEEWLTSNFPFDTIDEIKKGMKGADCIQTVNTRNIQNCGTIYYESKRTKEFQKSWIEKFKEDIRNKNADLGVLVTEILPKEMVRMGMVDGVWICTYDEFKALSFILREHIIKLSHSMRTQENKSDKMSLLYTYLTSNEFRMQIEAIVEGFTQIQTDLASEKRAMARIWKQREKQISKVIDSTIGMYGSVRGIAGSAVESVQALELMDSKSEKS